MTPSDKPSGEVPADSAGSQELLAEEPGSQTFEPDSEPQPGRAQRLFGSLPTWLVALILVVATVAPAGYLIHIPYYSVGPGPSVDVLSLIDVRGAKTYPSRGKLLLTTASVSVDTLNIWSAFYAWADPDTALVPRGQVVGPGLSDEEQDLENQLEMDESKFLAEVAAFRALHLPVARIAGARILATTAGMPAEGKLLAHDLIVSVDRKPVRTVDDVSTLMRKHKIGDRVRIGFIRGTAPHAVTLTTAASAGLPKRPVIGVELSAAFRLPHDVEIDTQRIVGPSGGMIFAIAIYDAFTADDLTKGHVIAGTGAIYFNAKGDALVGDIGAIEEKIRAARVSGADVFLAPADQAAAARKVAPKSMKVIGVHTLAQALSALRALSPLRR